MAHEAGFKFDEATSVTAKLTGFEDKLPLIQPFFSPLKSSRLPLSGLRAHMRSAVWHVGHFEGSQRVPSCGDACQMWLHARGRSQDESFGAWQLDFMLDRLLAVAYLDEDCFVPAGV